MMGELGTIEAVKGLVYDSVFKRAQDIAASDKLRTVVFEGDSLAKGKAECIGSSPSDVYALSVSINGAAAVGDCNCPAGKAAKSGLCKHAVALLLRRVQEIRRLKVSPSSSASEEELTIPIASQIDDIAPRHEARNPADGGGMPQSTISRGIGIPASSSKRALPAWMLGLAGSAAESSKPPNSKKRAVAPKPPRPAPPPSKRARRSGQPLKIANDSDEGEEDPGEVEDALPMEEGDAPAVVEDDEVAVVEDDEVAEPIIYPTEGAAARERRRLRALKKEDTAVVAPNARDEDVKKARGRPSRSIVIEDDEFAEPTIPPTEGAAARERRRLRALKKEEAAAVALSTGDEDVKKAKGRPSRSATKAEVQPVHASKRRRLVKKTVEEDSDVSENEFAPGDVVGDNSRKGFSLTDDDLVLLAKEQLEREKTAPQAEDLELKEQAEPFETTKLPGKASQGKKSSSIFSMDKWKDLTSAGAGHGGTLSLSTDDLNLDTSKNYPIGGNSQSLSLLDRPPFELKDEADGLLSSLSTFEAAAGLKDVPLPIAPAPDETDAVANDMLYIMFGNKLGGHVAAKNVSAASCTPSSFQENHNGCASTAGLVAPTPFSSFPESLDRAPTIPAAGENLDDLGVQPKPKKKSSLKDKVKMFLN